MITIELDDVTMIPFLIIKFNCKSQFLAKFLCKVIAADFSNEFSVCGTYFFHGAFPAFFVDKHFHNNDICITKQKQNKTKQNKKQKQTKKPSKIKTVKKGGFVNKKFTRCTMYNHLNTINYLKKDLFQIHFNEKFFKRNTATSLMQLQRGKHEIEYLCNNINTLVG